MLIQQSKVKNIYLLSC